MCADAPKPYRPRRRAVSRRTERAIADQSRAQQRRSLDVAERAVDGKAEPRVGDGVLGVATVDVIAGESRAVAQILAPGRAVPARAARPAEPGDADAFPDADRLHPGSGLDHLTDDLVARDQRQLRMGQLAVDHVQVGAAQAARADLDQHLSTRGLRRGGSALAQSATRRVEDHRSHGQSIVVAGGQAAAVNPGRRGGDRGWTPS